MADQDSKRGGPELDGAVSPVGETELYQPDAGNRIEMGKVIARTYRLIELLGKGGMGQV